MSVRTARKENSPMWVRYQKVQEINAPHMSKAACRVDSRSPRYGARYRQLVRDCGRKTQVANPPASKTTTIGCHSTAIKKISYANKTKGKDDKIASTHVMAWSVFGGVLVAGFFILSLCFRFCVFSSASYHMARNDGGLWCNGHIGPATG